MSPAHGFPTSFTVRHAQGFRSLQVTSAIHEAVWRWELTPANADALRLSLTASPIEEDLWPGRQAAAWDVAEELGWAKTYDAEFVALARHRGCLLVTTDQRLRRGADRLGLVRTPSEILATAAQGGGGEAPAAD